MNRPNPLLTRAGLVTAITILSSLLVRSGGGHAPVIGGWLEANASLIADAILAVGALVTAALARKHVTPVSDPRNNAGEVLAPVPAVPGSTDAIPLGVPTEQV